MIKLLDFLIMCVKYAMTHLSVLFFIISIVCFLASGVNPWQAVLGVLMMFAAFVARHYDC